jgi:hypothetical protein
MSCKMCVRIFTGRALSMVGYIKGFTLAKQINLNIFHTRRFIHREALISKTLLQ